MALYEKRTYSIIVGRMPEVVRLYNEQGWPALQAGGYADHLVGYFTSDTGTLHQLIHIWRFDDDTARREFWKRLYADEAFMKFAVEIRQSISHQDVQLLQPAPWGPQP